MRMGYALSSEEHQPGDLVRYAREAEEAGFEFAFISDHFHPWIDRQGHSPFVWSILGAISQVTTHLRVGTSVTCPIQRMHPAIVAQAAATAAAMLPGRFVLGVGTGEALNEHVTGERWPNLRERRARLAEAIDIIRLLWTGESLDYDGQFYTVQDARLYTLPPEPPPIYVAASGPRSARLAAELGDGLISTAPASGIVESYLSDNALPGPRIGQLAVCWAPTVEEAEQTVLDWWPTAGVRGELTAELPLPRHFEQAAKMVSREDVVQQVLCGPDVGLHLAKIQEFAEAGYDHVYVHQIGPDQEGFFAFFSREVMPGVVDQAA